MAAAAAPQSMPGPLFAPNARVLFQGDSITDMARGRTEDPNHILGHSYVFLIAAREGARYPEGNITFINRGVGGNTLPDLVTRWQKDALDLKPDVLSILIGVNDVGHAIRKNGRLSIAEYEKSYDDLLARTLTALPHVKLVLCEPFFADGKSTHEHLADWGADIRSLQAAVGRLGAKYHAPVVHLQQAFDAAAKRAPVSYWIWDGVHPTYRGQQLLADEWVRTYRAFYGTPAATP
jgi:lysophospholipase L1-like esterase